jgi:hypothetical protein
MLSRGVDSIKHALILILTAVWIIMTACDAEGTAAAAEETLPPAPAVLMLAGNGACDYTVVRSDYGNGAELDAALLVCKKFEEIAGVRPKITTDWEGNPVTEREIIVGETLREKTEGYNIDRAALGKNGFIIEAVGEKIFIAGGSREATYRAAEYFIDTFVTGQTVSVDAGYKYAVYQEFDIKSLSICGKAYADFVIVCDAQHLRKAAETLAESLADKTGKLLDVIVDEDYKPDGAKYKNVFLISAAKPETDGIHLVKSENGGLVFRSSSSETGIEGCVSRFISQYIANAYGNCAVEDDFIFAVRGDYISIKDPRN